MFLFFYDRFLLRLVEVKMLCFACYTYICSINTTITNRAYVISYQNFN